MANAKVSDDHLKAALRAYMEVGTQRGAARSLDMSRITFIHRYRRLQERGFISEDNHVTQKGHEWLEGDVVFPTFPDDDIPAAEIIDQHEKRFKKRLERFEALKWFEIKIREKKPIALVAIGDPHLGSNGCNVPLLKRDIAIMSSTEGMYAMNCGDTADNWGGRLTRLYAENDVSRETERRLAKWFLQDCGIKFLVWLEGNHDTMDGAMSAYLRGINAHRIPMVDWRAQFKLVFPRGREVRVDCAHDFKGHSMWNDLHSLDRASKEGQPAHIYIAGHRHLWAHKKMEAMDGTVVTLVRARGYKWIDDFAHRHQYGHKQVGASVALVIDPESETEDAMVTPFSDLEAARRYLEFLRCSR